MKDPSTILTKAGTPLLLVASRAAFAVYFVFAIVSIIYHIFPHSTENYIWLTYLGGILLLSEYTYRIFYRRGIDLTFAFPLLLAIYILNQITMQFGGQDAFPLLNRAEHFTTFALLTFIVWVFFLKYLPQAVWRNHLFYTAVLAFCVVAAFGVGNEIIELLMDVLFKTHFVGGRFDTSLDLLMNSSGAALFLSVRLWWEERGKKRQVVL